MRTALLTGRRRPGVRGAGAPVQRRSDGFEFAELREYVPGDDPRRIDWAATARAGALQTRVVFEDHALTLVAALDASASMFVGKSRSNYDLACDAARLWYGAALDDDRCGRIAADGVLLLRNLRGRAAAHVCSEKREVRGESFPGALDATLAAVPRNAHLLLVSDFFELAAVEPVLMACAARYDCTVLFARDPWHKGLPLHGFMRMRDAETGRTARVFIGSRERERYRLATAARESGIIDRLQSLGLRTGILDERGAERALVDAFRL